MRYFEIGWDSKEDGPGHRVIIYLQGCHLRCPWCHSPHSWSLQRSPLLYNSNLCIQCGNCVRICKNQVHKIIDGVHHVNRQQCIGCGACQKNCPSSSPDNLGSALCFPTKEKSPEELFELVKPQLGLFRTDGGVTLSGGEALLQIEDVKKFIRLCRNHNISVCIESSFTLPSSYYECVADEVDYWLCGMRNISFDGSGHNQDSLILENLNIVMPKAKNIIARYPLIEGYTTKTEQMERFQCLMQKSGISQIEILPCNPNMEHYYTLSGIPCALKGSESMPAKEQIQQAYHYFQSNKNCNVKIVE